MTLIVSLIVPDGIVIAGDSLSTMIGQTEFQGTSDVTCPKCQHQHEIQHNVPLPPVPMTTFSYAQKVFPFCKNFGIGTFGMGLVAGKSIYFAIRSLEHRVLNGDMYKPTNVTEVSKVIGDEIYKLLIKQLKQENVPLETLSPNSFPLGAQVVGYDGTDPKIFEVNIGRNVECRETELCRMWIFR